MPWFSKKSKRIETVRPEERVVKTENVFVKCDGCEAHLYKGELEEAQQVCKHCGYHFRIGARDRLAMLYDESKFEEIDAEVISIDPLDSGSRSNQFRQPGTTWPGGPPHFRNSVWSSGLPASCKFGPRVR